MTNKKVILITSGDSALGRTIAIKLAKSNRRVAITGADKVILDEIVSEMIDVSPDKRPEDFLAIECQPVCKDGDNKKALPTTSQVVRDRLLTHFDRLDVLINNATFKGDGCTILDDHFYGDFNSIIQANLKSAIHLTNKVRSDLIQSSGLVINTAFHDNQQAAASPNFGYSISKAGMAMLTKVLANAFSDLSKDALVRVVGIELGQQAGGFCHGERRRPFNLALEEVAELVTYLISGESNFIHGTVIKVGST